MKMTAVLAVASACGYAVGPAQAAGPCAAATPANITMAPLSPAVITADGTSQTSALVTLSDIFGNPVIGDANCLTPSASDAGMRFGTVVDNGDGTYTVTVVSSTTAHQVIVTVTETGASAGISASEPLTLAHGVASHVNVTLSTSVLIANGLSTTNATATVSDAYGNPINGDALLFSASDPGVHFGPVLDHGNGTYTATVHSSNVPGPVTVSVTDISAGASPVGTAMLTQTPAASLVTLVTMQWTFYFTRTYTVAHYLAVSGAPSGSVINMRCTGHGCPFSSLAVKTSKQAKCSSRSHGPCRSGSTVVLTKALAQRRLHIGARLTVMIVRRGWIGKYYSFRMRPGAGPVIRISCVAPGSTRPGTGC